MKIDYSLYDKCLYPIFFQKETGYYLWCRKRHSFGASKTMHNDNLEFCFVLRDASLNVSQVPPISESDSWYNLF